jgi:hypothetical protein
MKLRVILLAILCGTFMFVIESNSFNLSQTLAQANSNLDLSVPTKVVVRSSGWDLPFTRTAIKSGIKSLSIDRETVEKQQLVPTSEIFKLEEFYPYTKHELRIDVIDCRVGSIFSYSTKGRVFAYQVIFSPILAIDGNLSPTAAVFSFQYVDRDGDGVLETRIRSTSEPEIPSWVKTITG